MNDVKAIDELAKFYVEAHTEGKPYHPLAFFAEAVALTRAEPGVSIVDIAKCFKAQFSTEELESLIANLKQ